MGKLQKKTGPVAEVAKEKKVNQQIYISDVENLQVIGAMHPGDESIADTIKRMFRPQILAAVIEATDRKQTEARASQKEL